MQLREIPRSSNHVASLVVYDKGRWDKELLGFEAWTFECHGISFPLRIGARWRKTFTGQHAAAAQKKSVNILFTIIMPASTPERPHFQPQDMDGGPFASLFRDVCVNNLK